MTETNYLNYLTDTENDEEHTPRGAAVTDLIMAIFRANGRMLRAGDHITNDLGLTSTKWQVLGAIHPGPRTVAQIARDYEFSRQGILWVVQSMVKEGLVELVKNPDHRRAKLVKPTEHGRETYMEISRRQRLWSNNLAEAFRQEDLETAIATVRLLGERAKGTDEDDQNS